MQGEVVQLTRDQMHGLIQTDAEVSEVLMRGKQCGVYRG
jgi:thioredoxin reductase (NADPH)